jgi:hypothetical protein
MSACANAGVVHFRCIDLERQRRKAETLEPQRIKHYILMRGRVSINVCVYWRVIRGVYVLCVFECVCVCALCVWKRL